MSEPQWALAYHTNSREPRARKWYRVTRLIFADAAWWELYWHPEVSLRGDNKDAVRKAAESYGLTLLPGVYRDVPAPRVGSAMEKVR